jgi:hypothetical protein
MFKGVRHLAVIATCTALLPLQARAQWGATAIGVAEFDTKSTSVLLAGLSASPGGAGVRPLIGAQASYVSFDAGTTNVHVTTIRPYAGLQDNFTGGTVYGTLGYAFQSRSEDFSGNVVTTAGDTHDGAVLSGGLEYWGTGGPLGAQALASYNFGGKSIWTRGRVTSRVASLDNSGQVRLGGEVAYLHGDGYSVVQPGGLIEWHRSARGLILAGGIGEKFVKDGENATYFKAEIVLPIR